MYIILRRSRVTPVVGRLGVHGNELEYVLQSARTQPVGVPRHIVMQISTDRSRVASGATWPTLIHKVFWSQYIADILDKHRKYLRRIVSQKVSIRIGLRGLKLVHFKDLITVSG